MMATQEYKKKRKINNLKKKLMGEEKGRISVYYCEVFLWAFKEQGRALTEQDRAFNDQDHVC